MNRRHLFTGGLILLIIIITAGVIFWVREIITPLPEIQLKEGASETEPVVEIEEESPITLTIAPPIEEQKPLPKTVPQPKLVALSPEECRAIIATAINNLTVSKNYRARKQISVNFAGKQQTGIMAIDMFCVDSETFGLTVKNIDPEKEGKEKNLAYYKIGSKTLAKEDEEWEVGAKADSSYKYFDGAEIADMQNQFLVAGLQGNLTGMQYLGQAMEDNSKCYMIEAGLDFAGAIKGITGEAEMPGELKIDDAPKFKVYVGANDNRFYKIEGSIKMTQTRREPETAEISISYSWSDYDNTALQLPSDAQEVLDNYDEKVRQSDNDMAIGTLKQFTSTQAIWHQQDPDGNGKKDYWTYDVSCFHRMLRADKETKCAFIPRDVALADAKPADYIGGEVPFGGHVMIEPWPEAKITLKSGYFFQVMEIDEEGNPYKQNEVGDNGIKACNDRRFGFVAYPAQYGVTGTKTYIVNQDGTVYGTDCGSDANKIVLRWPGMNPIDVIGPGGKNWEVAE